jgi:hypothetical protein
LIGCSHIAQDAVDADQKAIALATRFGYTIPKAYQRMIKALKSLIYDASKQTVKNHY